MKEFSYLIFLIGIVFITSGLLILFLDCAKEDPVIGEIELGVGLGLVIYILIFKKFKK